MGNWGTCSGGIRTSWCTRRLVLNSSFKMRECCAKYSSTVLLNPETNQLRKSWGRKLVVCVFDRTFYNKNRNCSESYIASRKISHKWQRWLVHQVKAMNTVIFVARWTSQMCQFRVSVHFVFDSFAAYPATLTPPSDDEPMLTTWNVFCQWPAKDRNKLKEVVQHWPDRSGATSAKVERVSITRIFLLKVARTVWTPKLGQGTAVVLTNVSGKMVLVFVWAAAIVALVPHP